MTAGPALPDEMPVAVYRGVGDVVIEARSVPAPGAGPGARRGEPLRGVRLGPPHDGGGLGQARLRGWPRVDRHDRRGRPRRHAWPVGDQVVGGPSPKCGRCRRCLEGQPSQCENRRGAIADDEPRARSPRTSSSTSARWSPCPKAVDADAALAEPLAVALHGITRSGLVEATACSSSVPARSARSPSPRSCPRHPVMAVEPAPARAELAGELGAERVLHPDDLQLFPMWEPERISDLAVDVVLECSGKKVAMEAGFNQLRRGGTLVLVGAGIEPPTFDPNRMLLNELEVCGSFVYDADGFERALELLLPGGCPPTC